MRAWCSSKRSPASARSTSAAGCLTPVGLPASAPSRASCGSRARACTAYYGYVGAHVTGAISGALTALADLDLQGCDRIDDGGVWHVGALVHLAQLCLGGCTVFSAAGLGRLSRLTGLEEVPPRGCEGVCEREVWGDDLFDSPGLYALECLTRLCWLDLRGCRQRTTRMSPRIAPAHDETPHQDGVTHGDARASSVFE